MRRFAFSVSRTPQAARRLLRSLGGALDKEPKVYVGRPSTFQPAEIDEFVAFVVAGGEVAVNGLQGRVANQALAIAFLREEDCLLGVGGIKLPSANHRDEVSTCSKVKLSEQEYPFELGWVFILPSARGRKLSLPLCEALVAAATGRGVIATSHVANHGMHTTLGKLGFVRVGVEWPSTRRTGNLALFLKHDNEH
jgi:GNAT superfamily N-acetyltransferase